jgi:GR25 family glycosyltransferase involved in LPS biosynthesis
MKIRILLLIFSIIFLVCYIIKLFNLSYKNEYFYNDKIHIINIINLEIDKERLKKIKSNCDKFNINYNVIKAIDGLKYKLTQNDKIYLKNVNYDINIEKGVLGCHLSHIRLLEDFCKKKNKEYLIVVEDDTQIIEQNFDNIIDLILNKQKLNFDIIFLATSENLKPNTKLVSQINDKYALYDSKNKWLKQGAIFYIISLHGALDILSKYYNSKCKTAIDWFYINEMKQPLLLYPNLGIHASNRDSTNSSVLKKKIS